ncbi:MAG: NAD(P)H-hydrate dehydratase [Deltaproteobacteria bacterium]|nr:NAD(P)H-hydrate dehydratase [Deltaproteobacteria bacterium]
MSALPTIKELLDGKSVLALGPGMGVSEDAARLLTELLPSVGVPVVIDADGLNNLVGRTDVFRKCSAEIVITPHPGEMSRLAGLSTKDVMSDRVGVARRFAETHQVHVVLKGARTVVAAPDGRVWINPTGNPGMATAGSGDVLTGVIAGLVPQAGSVLEATLAGTYLHGLAGDHATARLGEKGVTASDILEHVPGAVKELSEIYFPPDAPPDEFDFDEDDATPAGDSDDE